MMDDKTLNAADELLAAAGMSTDDFSDTDEAPPAKETQEGEAKPEPWKAEISKIQEELRQSQQSQQYQVMQALSGALGKQAPPPAPDKDDLSPEDQTQLHQLAMTNPAVMQALIDRNVEKAVSARTKQMEAQLAAKMQRDGAQGYLRDQVYAIYGDEIKDPNSEIMRSLGAVQQKLRTMLDPSMHGTPQEAELAVLIAAGLNPKAVSKRQKSRDEAYDRTRNERLSRAAAMAGLGGREPAYEKNFTDDDLALFEVFGMDPDKDGDEIRSLKKKNKMNYLSGSRIVGGQ
jgi:hypothetical protein